MTGRGGSGSLPDMCFWRVKISVTCLFLFFFLMHKDTYGVIQQTTNTHHHHRDLTVNILEAPYASSVLLIS